MKHKNRVGKMKLKGKDLVRYFILVYWLLFWLLNVVDKLIGGAHFLFVGKDRFAQMQRFFDSIGLGAPIVANIALMVTAALETFALVFFVGSLHHFVQRNKEATRLWFAIGIALTLITFTFFSIGDQVFGDHLELLEHGLFWFMGLLSWLIFVQVDKIQIFDKFLLGKRQLLAATFVVVAISLVTTLAIFGHNSTAFVARSKALAAVKLSENRYRISFPFLAGSTAFERSIARFKEENPTEHISHIYTAPSQLRLGQADGLIIYIQTEHK